MPTYKYIAINESGKKVNGILSSESERAARLQIKSSNLTPLSLDVTTRKQFLRVRVSNKQLLFATRQIATLLDSSISIDETLKSIALEVEDKSLSTALHAVRDEILQGSRIAEAMSSHPSIFNETYRSLVAAGDAAGNLHIAFSNLADYLEESALVRQQVISALAYPMILMVFSVGVVFALLTFVMPQVVDQFVRAGAQLPTLTAVLMGVSNYSGLILLSFLLLILGSFFYYRHLIQNKQKAISVHRRFLKIPLIGAFILNAEVERFSRVMHLMMKSGLNLDVAMQQAHVVIGNRYIAKSVEDARVELVEGKDFIQSLREARIFPSLFVQLLSSGYKSGNLTFMFEKVAQYMKGEIESKRSTVLSLLEPLVIIFGGGIILLIVLAILLPIMQMNSMALG
ncbi:type II secretion system F family protein [Gammaproteobacteria bacterium]|jgi:general secretion pathway protein F|nr:type II secretion system F family protein [Gammaproteobacteria bacterium]MDB0009789.1 type II secretion system F family protein [Gammaproteobacteria bacterium]MDB4194628.1 type II secretion system F family protein [Gammaproteobacteria bacterium]MDC0513263.1 type II secretion system F family protein [Gammaproteobacteria bacterium]